MADSPDADLDFAYKYPFSNEAKEYVAKLNAPFDQEMMKQGRLRLERAFGPGIGGTAASMKEVKRIHVLSYLYARMLVSAMGSKLALDAYVRAEARRAGELLRDDTEQNILRVANELGVRLSLEREFSMGFADYLMLSPKTPDFALVHQDMLNGVVHLTKYKASRIVEKAAAAEMARGLPIPLKAMPKEVAGYAKEIKAPVSKISVRIDERKYDWIAKLIENPIADVRHRTINLILAPYLINVKKMDEEQAVKVIVAYIEKCKLIDPNTNVNESYIRYQCRYAKQKGMKPMTYDNAKELLKGVIAF